MESTSRRGSELKQEMSRSRRSRRMASGMAVETHAVRRPCCPRIVKVSLEYRALMTARGVEEEGTHSTSPMGTWMYGLSTGFFRLHASPEAEWFVSKYIVIQGDYKNALCSRSCRLTGTSAQPASVRSFSVHSKFFTLRWMSMCGFLFSSRSGS